MARRIYKSDRFASREVIASARRVLREFRDVIRCARRPAGRRHNGLRVRFARPSFIQEKLDAL
jgi:hypothetical protein